MIHNGTEGVSAKAVNYTRSVEKTGTSSSEIGAKWPQWVELPHTLPSPAKQWSFGDAIWACILN